MEVEISAVGGVSPDSPLGQRSARREGGRRRSTSRRRAARGRPACSPSGARSGAQLGTATACPSLSPAVSRCAVSRDEHGSSVRLALSLGARSYADRVAGRGFASSSALFSMIATAARPACPRSRRSIRSAATWIRPAAAPRHRGSAGHARRAPPTAPHAGFAPGNRHAVDVGSVALPGAEARVRDRPRSSRTEFAACRPSPTYAISPCDPRALSLADQRAVQHLSRADRRWERSWRPSRRRVERRRADAGLRAR